MDSASSPLTHALVSTSTVTLPRTFDARRTDAVSAYVVSTAGSTSSDPDLPTARPLIANPTRHPTGTLADQRNVAGPWNGRIVVGFAVKDVDRVPARHSSASSSMSGTSLSRRRFTAV